MVVKVDPKVDYAFKKMVGAEGRERILKHLIEAVLGLRLPRPLVYVEILNPFNDKDALDDKLSVFDVKARDSDGRWYNIEMQMLPGRHFRNRALYYGSTLHARQLSVGEDYRELQDTIVICFVNAVIYRETLDYRLLFEMRSREHPELLLSPQLSVYLIELPKFDLTAEQLSTPLEQWCYLLRHGEGLDTTALPAGLRSPAIQEAAEVLSMLDQTPLERERYESRLKAQRDYSIGLYEARMEGLEEGEKKGKLEGIKEGILKQIEKLYRFKFGAIDADLMRSMYGLNDTPKIEEIYDTLLHAASAQVFQAAITAILSPSS